jgi:hypothetical protein
MAFKRTMCGNPACPKHTTYSGGEFIYSPTRKAFFCKDCFYEAPVLPTMAKSAFDFVTTAITGKLVHVTSMQHLQRLEVEHGCSSVVLNCDRSNWDRPKQPRENWQTPPSERMSHGVTVGEVHR